jgi:hypothetical protein
MTMAGVMEGTCCCGVSLSGNCCPSLVRVCLVCEPGVSVPGRQPYVLGQRGFWREMSTPFLGGPAAHLMCRQVQHVHVLCLHSALSVLVCVC